MSKTYWVTIPKTMTCTVATDANGTVVEAAPILRKFLGQPVGNLERWVRRFPKARIEPLEHERLDRTH